MLNHYNPIKKNIFSLLKKFSTILFVYTFSFLLESCELEVLKKSQTQINPPLSLTSASPSTGYYLGGTVINLYGTGFSRDTQVSVNNNICANMNMINSTQITCLTPSSFTTNLTADITVTREGQTKTLVNGFTYHNFTRMDSIAGAIGTYASTDGTGNLARFSQSLNAYTLINKTLYVADGANNKIRQIDLSNLNLSSINKADVTVSTLSGSGSSAFTDSSDGTGSTASLYYPFSLLSISNILYLSDGGWVKGRSEIRKANSSTGKTTTFLSETDLGTTLLGQMVYDGGSYLYATDGGNDTIQRININDKTMTILAGTSGVTGDLDGIGTAARFSTPYGLALSADKTILYFTDGYNCKIKKLDLNSLQVTTLSSGVGANFNLPSQLALSDQYLLISDWGNCSVKQMRLDTYDVATIVGTSSTCASTDGTLASARLGYPVGIYYSPNYGIFSGTSNWAYTGAVIDGVIRLIH